MKLNIKFSHVEKAGTPQESSDPVLKDAVDDDGGKKGSSSGQPEKEAPPEKSTDQKEKKSPDATSRLTLDDLKEKKSRSMGFFLGLLILAVLVFLGVSGYLLLNSRQAGKSSSQAAYNDFTAESFLENPASFSGNRYQAPMRVESQIGFDPKVGRLMVFKEDKTQKSFPVLIPTELDKVNIEKGQLLMVRFVVKEGGLIYAEDIQKP